MLFFNLCYKLLFIFNLLLDLIQWIRCGRNYWVWLNLTYWRLPGEFELIIELITLCLNLIISLMCLHWPLCMNRLTLTSFRSLYKSNIWCLILSLSLHINILRLNIYLGCLGRLNVLPLISWLGIIRIILLYKGLQWRLLTLVRLLILLSL